LEPNLETRPRFYGRRRGKKLRPGQQTRLQDLLPALSIRPPLPGAVLDPFSLFDPRPRAIWLEVGFGAGEHASAQAEANPDVGLIASEVFLNGIGGLLAKIEAGKIGNIRLFPEDVRQLLPALPEGSIERVFVLFPDPWPKKRHRERRFIGAENLTALARLLADGGELRIASDHPVYIEWAREQMAARQEFTLILDADARPEGWPATRYEAKALSAGTPCVYLAFRRLDRSSN
jgi:tRNA (guanine-N7-)-methyltransferase